MAVLLAQLLAKRGRLAPQLAIDIVVGVTEALELSGATVSNLLALSPETVEVDLDCATGGVLSVAFHPEWRSAFAFQYMAWPEYAAWLTGVRESGDWPGGEPAAVYCLAVLLFHMLVDRALFARSDLLSLSMAHLTQRAPRLTDSRLPDALIRLVGGCLSRTRASRLESLATLRTALRTLRVQEGPKLLSTLGLTNTWTGRWIPLNAIAGMPQDDGSRQIRVGRNDARAQISVDVDLHAEPFGRGVHRRQAILRESATGEWSVEEWGEPKARFGSATAVNRVLLESGERRPLALGDVLAFGPVQLVFEQRP